MKRQYLVAVLVLAVGAFACERKSEPPPSETTTTSGTMGEEQEHTETTGAPSVKAGDTTGAETAGTVGEESLRAGADAGVAIERRDAGLGTTENKASKANEAKAKAKTTPKTTTTDESTTLGDDADEK